VDLKAKILELLVTLVLPSLLSVIALALSVLGGLLIKWLATKIKNQQIVAFLGKANTLAHDAVMYVDGVIKPDVVKASADGVITPAEAKQLRDEALAALMKFLGDKGVTEAKALLGVTGEQLATWLQGLIEKAVATKNVTNPGVTVSTASQPLDAIASMISRTAPGVAVP
jgi:hypothetical protein